MLEKAIANKHTRRQSAQSTTTAATQHNTPPKASHTQTGDCPSPLVAPAHPRLSKSVAWSSLCPPPAIAQDKGQKRRRQSMMMIRSDLPSADHSGRRARALFRFPRNEKEPATAAFAVKSFAPTIFGFARWIVQQGRPVQPLMGRGGSGEGCTTRRF